ncbi:MAG: hypothetical protein HYY02_01520 [Chloroflexi bacterium]|nr:hypothetical protein [Chloroflexota bacterium]
MTSGRDNRGRRRVVVTGMGAVTPLGLNVADFWAGLVQGRSGIGQITLCNTEGYPTTIAAEVKGFDPRAFMDAKDARRLARFSQFAVASSKMALEDARLDLASEDASRVGVVLGNGNGGQNACLVLRVYAG